MRIGARCLARREWAEPEEGGAETVTDCGADGRGRVGVASYCQVLRGEAGQAGQTAPGRGAVQLLHLLS